MACLDLGPFYLNCKKAINKFLIVSIETAQYHDMLQFPNDWGNLRQAKIKETPVLKNEKRTEKISEFYDLINPLFKWNKKKSLLKI